MLASTLLLHPDRMRIAEQDGVWVSPGAQEWSHGIPLTLSANYAAFARQNRIVVQTSDAMEHLLQESDIAGSVRCEKIGVSEPFYCAFARTIRHPALRGYEGAYVQPVTHRDDVICQFAYVINPDERVSPRGSDAPSHAAVVEQIPFRSGHPLACAHDDTWALIRNTELDERRHRRARDHLFKVLLTMRIGVEGRAHHAEGRPWGLRSATQFNTLEIGPDDLSYQVADHRVGESGQAIHSFSRGLFGEFDGRIGWRRPGLTLCLLNEQPASSDRV